MLCFLLFIHVPSSISKALQSLSPCIFPFLRGNVKETYFSKIKYFNLYSFILTERQECHFEVGLAFRINRNFCILIVGTIHS